MAARTETDRRETLRVQYAAVAARDIALGQWRFQAMLIFITAVALIADHVKTQQHELAVILIVLGLGMWILDLRNRALVWDLRDDLRSIESGLEGKSPDDQKEADKFRLVDAYKFRLVSHTTVFDFSYGVVFWYGLSLFLSTSEWLVRGAFALVLGAALVFGAHQCRFCIQRRFGKGSATAANCPKRTPTENRGS
jgi:hypothetical protein